MRSPFRSFARSLAHSSTLGVRSGLVGGLGRSVKQGYSYIGSEENLHSDLSDASFWAFFRVYEYFPLMDPCFLGTKCKERRENWQKVRVQ